MNKMRFLACVALALGGVALPAQSAEMRLATALELVGARQGFEIVLAAGLEEDTIEQPSLDANVRKILKGYNYTAIQKKDGSIEKIMVSGRNGKLEPASAEAPAIADGELLNYEPTPTSPPAKYQNRAPGTVLAVNLPTERLTSMRVGDKINLALPRGNFEVTHDNRFEHENGEITWVGYLNQPGKDFRIIITMGPEGSVGQIHTPNGIYSIDLEEQRNWLVEVSGPEADSLNSLDPPVDPDSVPADVPF